MNSIMAITLIELIITISITTILTGTVIFMLKTSFDAHFFIQEQVLLEKALDDCLSEISGGGFEKYGVKDSLEILDVGPVSITFVPFWVDDTHIALAEHGNPRLMAAKPFILNRPFKAGASLPICEVTPISGGRTRAVPIIFVFGDRKDPLKLTDKVYLNEPIVPGSKIRFIFQPDATDFPDCAMTIKWDNNKITRVYQGRTETIPKYKLPGVTITGLKIQYFDNTNTGVAAQSEQLPNITAVKFIITAAYAEKQKAQGKKLAAGQRVLHTASAFINLRNTRAAGAGLILREGTTVKIPDSGRVRIFSLSNIIGARPGGIIELEARPEKGTTWKISMELGEDNGRQVIRKYNIDYPPGETLYSETINLTLDQPLNLMHLGPTSRYDYDFDKDGNNVVDLSGEVNLVVKRMDAGGAMLFIRP